MALGVLALKIAEPMPGASTTHTVPCDEALCSNEWWVERMPNAAEHAIFSHAGN